MARTKPDPSSPDGLTVVVDRTVLQSALGRIARIVEKRNTIPVLSHVLLSAEAGGPLVISGTDLDLQITVEAQADVTTGGSITAPAQALHDIARNLPGDARVTLKVDPVGLRTIVTSGRSRFTLPGYPKGDFPDLQLAATNGKPVEIAGSILADMLAKTSFSISSEETRYYLNGIYCHLIEAEGEQRLRFVATDGHRLARMETALATNLDQPIAGVIIPRKTVDALDQLAGAAGDAPVAIEFANLAAIRFRHGNVRIASKVIDGTFPDYQRVVPTGNARLMTAPTRELSAALKRVGALSEERKQRVRLDLENDTLRLSLNNASDGSDAADEVAVESESNPFSIGFNASFLAQMLALSGGDTVRVKFGDTAGEPVLVFPKSGDDSALWVLMPMRI